MICFAGPAEMPGLDRKNNLKELVDCIKKDNCKLYTCICTDYNWTNCNLNN